MARRKAGSLLGVRSFSGGGQLASEGGQLASEEGVSWQVGGGQLASGRGSAGK